MLARTRPVLLLGTDMYLHATGQLVSLELAAPRRRDGLVQRQALQGPSARTAQAQLDVLRISVKSGPGVGSGSLCRPDAAMLVQHESRPEVDARRHLLSLYHNGRILRVIGYAK
jgi:hypothetical protein